jgi:acyl carrier protein
MTQSEAKAMVCEILGGIAPEADFAGLGGSEDLREALDLDSMDFMNFVIALHERTGIDIPEADYSKLRTLDCVTDYLAEATRREQGSRS